MRWLKDDIDQNLVRSMAKRYGIDLLTASILARRNIVEPAQIRFFLESDIENQYNPFLFDAMEDAVDRILLAADEGEKVLVFGDSDTDGVTATTLLTEALKEAGIVATWKVPVGEEPYGMTKAAVDAHANEGGTLIVTVDCGISNHEEVAYASTLGIDTIICDHHRLQAEKPPEALAVIDPKVEGCGYPFRDLAGAGVAYKLACALKFARTGLYKQSFALLSLRREGDSGYVVEAVKLHNLVATGRFSESLDEKSPRASLVLDKLARFLEGRSIITWRKAAQAELARNIFGAGIDIESFDISAETGILFPAFNGKTLSEIAETEHFTRFSEGSRRDIDVLETLFSMYAFRKSGAFGSSEHIQLAALGTIADLMPLKDENRLIVSWGIEGLRSAPRKGLRELLQSLALGRNLTSTEIAWQVTPLLNAAGRIGKPQIALELLMSDDPGRRAASIEEIKLANAERKKLGADVWEAVYPLAGESHRESEGRYVLVGSAFIKSGITGLLASRMVNVFKAPAIVAAFRDDGTVVGSVRTSNGFKISGLLSACSEFFLDYGGHDAAAGFSLPQADWERFRARAVEYLGTAEMAVAEEVISIDAELPHAYLKPELHKMCQRFEPFGEENPPLVFLAKNVGMVDAQIVGKSAKSHLKLTLDFGQYKWPALLWDGAERLERDFSFRTRDRLDVLFKVTVNRWNGEEKPQLELYDVRRAE